MCSLLMKVAGSPSKITQKKVSSLYGATTESIVLPKQGVTPMRELAKAVPQRLADGRSNR